MDIRVVERTPAAVGEQPVQLGHTPGIRLRFVLEGSGDLQQIGPHQGNPVMEKDLEPATRRVTRWPAVREAFQGPDQAAPGAGAEPVRTTAWARMPNGRV
jgi:hypothetical protein